MSDRAFVGGVEILALIDATPAPFARRRLFPDVSDEQWEPYKKFLSPDGNVPLDFAVFVLRSKGKMVLVDTGVGPGPHENSGGTRGHLLDVFKSKGIKPEDFDSVVITHLHGDHVGWNATRVGGKLKPVFPRARYYIPQADLDYFTTPDVLARNPGIKDNVVGLKEMGVVELVGDGHVVTPEVTMLAAPGHTPGHMCVLVSSQGEKGMVVGDLFHNQAEVTESDWLIGPDVDRELGRKSRNTVMERLENERFTVAAGHLMHDEKIGRIVRLKGRRYWQVL